MMQVRNLFVKSKRVRLEQVQQRVRSGNRAKWLILAVLLLGVFSPFCIYAQISSYNPIWLSQSKNSSESMPLGGGDIGLNVWTENNDILFYMARSGTFDENNSLLKLGRVRISLSPNPFKGASSFKQELHLNEGYISITSSKGKETTTVKLWVNVFRPVVNVEVESTYPVTTTATYESWRHHDRILKGKENNQNSYKWAPQGEVKTFRDSISTTAQGIVFYHKNRDFSIFDVTVKQQGLDSVRDQLYNPLKDLVFGGVLMAKNFAFAGTNEGKYIDTDFKGWSIKSKTPQKSAQIKVFLQTGYHKEIKDWQKALSVLTEKDASDKKAFNTTKSWWSNYWKRSFVFTDPERKNADTLPWQIGRNYQLMRYMLASNASGTYPTKFNGGLFTCDPSLTDSTLKFTPDFRNWGGGIHTAQNQRLVYWPMLKNGDFSLMKPQFDFYKRLLKNAELRSKVYWNHAGACFTEQLENFGLPNSAEYNWKRPANYDKGMEHNAWLEYEWDTALEFCQMILETERYNKQNIKEYIPMIESCLRFFNEHYQYLAKQRGSKAFDANGHLVLYPGSAAETYKMAYNASSTVAALKTVLTSLLALPSDYLNEEQRKEWQTMLGRIPPISFRQVDGKTTISPAIVWERINNTESPQLYPVFPWGIYGVGKPGLDTAINTFKYDPDVLKSRSHVGWKQDNVFAARLGLTDEAWQLSSRKLKDSGLRFPAFWGPGFDWTPDHNWGGSGMIGLQEMLLQADGKKIYLFPAWPKEKDVHFKLFAPYNTTVEAKLTNGKLEFLKVLPKERTGDVISLLK